MDQLRERYDSFFLAPSEPGMAGSLFEAERRNSEVVPVDLVEQENFHYARKMWQAGLVLLGNALLVANFPVRHGPAIFLNPSHPIALLRVVSADDFSGGPMSPHSIASAFGKHLALSTASGTPPSLPTMLEGTSARTEIQIGSDPKNTSSGPERDSSGLCSAGGHVQQVPIDVSTGKVYLILFGTGFDYPPGIQAAIKVPGGKVSLTATYAGPQSQFPGLDQVNVPLPRSLAGNGVSYLSFEWGSSQQPVYITIR